VYDGDAAAGGANIRGNGWYYVSGDVTISSTVTVSGNVYLNLADGADLQVTSSEDTPGDNDSDGIEVGSNIVLNGGTIKNTDADTEPALNHISDTSNVLVDTTAPIVSGITPADGAEGVPVDGKLQSSSARP
jgi:hypothetical protein